MIYNLEIVDFKIENKDILFNSIFELINRHVIFKTVYKKVVGNPSLEEVLNADELKQVFKVEEQIIISENDLTETLHHLEKYKFDLEKEISIKVIFTQIRFNSSAHRFLLHFVLHRKCAFNFTITGLVGDLIKIYDHFYRQIENKKSELNIHYEVFNKEYQPSEESQTKIDYSKKKLSGFETLNLVCDYGQRPQIFDFCGENVFFELNEETSTKLKEMAKTLNVSLFSLLLSAYNLTLSTFSNQNDILIGTIVKNKQELNEISDNINMTVMRIKINYSDLISEYIQQVNNEVDQSQKNVIPFERLLKEMKLEGDSSRHPLFQVAFFMDDFPVTSNTNTLKFIEYNHINGDTVQSSTIYDLKLTLSLTDTVIKGCFKYANKILMKQTILKYKDSYETILNEFVKYFNERKMHHELSTVKFLSSEHTERILSVVNYNHDFQYRTNDSLHRLFELEVEKFPNRLAVVFNDIELTYKELNEKSNALAHYLNSLDLLQPNDIISVYLDKSHLTIICILAIWKVGAAYVPIDTIYPMERVMFILNEIDSKLILSTEPDIKNVEEFDIKAINVEEFFNQKGNNYLKTNFDHSNRNAKDLAAIFYTSGTTKNPKAVLLNQINFLSLLYTLSDSLHDDFPKTTLNSLFTANYVFVVSVGQIFLPLINSGTLVIPSDNYLIDDSFDSNINKYKVSYLHCTPTLLTKLNLTRFKYLKYIRVGGEVLSKSIFEKVRSEYNGIICNSLGSTETSITITAFVYDSNNFKYYTIGYPIKGRVKTFVLNKQCKLLPFGGIGELYVTGPCLTSGYLNRPELNAEKFLDNPFQTEEEIKLGINKKIYKTGDLVRLLENGEIELFGRNDMQVKINGVRIELAEIESTISSYPDIKNSVVINRENTLISYYVSDNFLNETSIKDYLYLKLPSYMIPTKIIKIQHIPITENGKLDVKALIEMNLHIDKILDYWVNKLNGFETLNIICDYGKRPQINEYKGENVFFELDEETSTKLKEIAKTLNVSLFSLILSAYNLTLSIFANQNDILIGTHVKNKQELNEISDINMTVMRIKINYSDLISEYIQQVNNEVDQSQKNVLPFERLLKEMKLEGDSSMHPLFQVALFIEDNKIESKDKNCYLVDYNNSWYSDKYLCSPLDLSLIMSNCNKELSGRFNFSLKIFKKERIYVLCETFKHILKQLSFEPSKNVISSLNFLTENTETILNNNKFSSMDKKNDVTTLTKYFEMEVEKNSKNVAVVYNNEVEISYEELNIKANQLAHYLRSIDLIKSSNDVVALFLDKSHFTIISILATWKSGVAYVPIESNYPIDRAQFILNDSNSKIVITNTVYASLFKNIDCFLIIIEDFYNNMSSNYKSSNPNNLSSDLAVILYTSGTTGKPKGVLIEHKNYISHFNYIKELFKEELDKTKQTSLLIPNYVFDISFIVIFTTIFSGGTLLVPKNNLIVDEAMYMFLNKYKLTNIICTPTQIAFFDLRHLPDLQIAYIIGEAITKSLFEKVRNEYHGKFINGYGPTETSITITAFEYDINEFKYYTIGWPKMSHAKVFVMKNGKLLPFGAIGELYISGSCVTRGYLNRPELNDEKFLSNPFQTEEEKKLNINKRMYKTGDLVRLLENGELEFFGRNDMQVKIRGFRIELGEIETTLSSYPKIKKSIAINRDNKYLVAYYVSDYELDELDMKQFLYFKLPYYMIPNRIIKIDSIPINANGKLNLKVLLNIETNTIQKDRIIILPKNEIESKLIEIWSELLKMDSDKFGIDDDFFSLGGDSILATHLFFYISNNLKIKSPLTLSNIYKYRTISQIAKIITNTTDTSTVSLRHNTTKTANIDGRYPLSLVQESFIFFTNFYRSDIKSVVGYNISYNIEIHNFKVENKTILFDSIYKLLERHEILRTLFKTYIDGVYQSIISVELIKSYCKIEKKRVSNELELQEVLKEFNSQRFNLENEFPIKIEYVELTICNADYPTKFYISFLFNHICYDGWSHSIFMRDLEYIYKYNYLRELGMPEEKIEKYKLNDLELQYKDYALWEREYLTSEKLEQMLDYWKNKLDGFETLNLICDYGQRPQIFDFSGDNVFFELDEETSTKLKEMAKTLKVSLFSLLLSAYALALSIFANQNDILIGTVVANRNKPELEELMGCFINMIALRIKINLNNSLTEYVENVSSEVIEAQVNREFPFEKLVRELKINGDPTRHPIFQATFFMENFYEINRMDRDKSNDGLVFFKRFNTRPNIAALYDLRLIVTSYDTSINAYFNYATNIFKKESISNITICYKKILIEFATSYSQDCLKKNLYSINYLTDSQCGRLETLINCFETSSVQDQNETIHELFEKEVERSSEKLAVVNGDIEMTYRELNEKSNQLVHYIKSMDLVKNENRIALFLDRSYFTIISILAVWKVGCAYVPIDTSYPLERVNFIINDSKSKILISENCYMNHVNNLGDDKLKVINIEEFFNNQHNDYSKSNIFPCLSKSNNLAVVLFTSGTTGKPKGVLVEHRHLISFNNTYKNLLDKEFRSYPISSLLYSKYVFDVSLAQILIAFLSSGTLIIPPKTYLFNDDFYSYLNKYKLTYIYCTPSQICEFNLSKLQYLKILNVGGEAMTKKFFSKIRSEYKGKLLNLYGPTETSIAVTAFDYDETYFDPYSIGEPIYGHGKVLVLNSNMKLVPFGGIGELYVTGPSVTRGYLNRPELNEERFLDNPFQTEHEIKLGINKKIYKTGDLVRLLENGKIDYFGRNDMQVKIKGVRIELGEIESTLSTYPAIINTVVVVTERNETKYIIAYYISEHELDELQMKLFLESKLPKYMIPNRIIKIEKISKTVSGKLDFRSLPSNYEISIVGDYCGPRNEIESALCKIWCSILQLDKVSITDDFFQIGGDSILAISFMSEIEKYNLKISFTINDLFLHKTIRNICEKCSKFKDDEIINIEMALSSEITSYLKTMNLPILKQAFFMFNKTANKTLFLLPASEGGAEMFFNTFIPSLGSLKIIAFNNYYRQLEIENLHHNVSFEILAKIYLFYIKAIQPVGPYNILGWCFGGSIALEIARLLVNNNEVVDNLVFIESIFDIEKVYENLQIECFSNGIFHKHKVIPFENTKNLNNVIYYKAERFLTENEISNTFLSSNGDLIKVWRYYFDKCVCNYLDEILPKEKIQIQYLWKESHDSWKKNEMLIKEICRRLIQMINKET